MDSQIHVSIKGQPASFIKRQSDQSRHAIETTDQSVKALAKVVNRLKVKGYKTVGVIQ